jgi:MFS family permease
VTINPFQSDRLRSLRIHNYRIWFGGAFVSNIGTWMQRTGQDWLVLTVLTHNSGTALGIVMALQFGPQLLFLPWTGSVADQFDRRRLVMVTQTVMGTLSLTLGALTIAGLVQLWQVYVFAFLFGSMSAFEAPARQAFISELVGDASLANAIALNSTSFNLARMIGPAVAGVCIAAWGTGWAFVINGISFVAVFVSMRWLRLSEIQYHKRAARVRGGFAETLRYLRSRPDLLVLLTIVFLIGTFGMNFPIYISTMAIKEFGVIAAGPTHPTLARVAWGAAAFGATLAVAALMPSYWFFAAMLTLVGIAALTVLNTSSSLLQLSTDSAMRGRVISVRLAIAAGGTPLGAPLVGWVADRFGPRWSLGVGASAGLMAALVGYHYLRAHKRRRKISPTMPVPSIDEAIAEELIDEK